MRVQLLSATSSSTSSLKPAVASFYCCQQLHRQRCASTTMFAPTISDSLSLRPQMFRNRECTQVRSSVHPRGPSLNLSHHYNRSATELSRQNGKRKFSCSARQSQVLLGQSHETCSVALHDQKPNRVAPRRTKSSKPGCPKLRRQKCWQRCCKQQTLLLQQEGT